MAVDQPGRDPRTRRVAHRHAPRFGLPPSFGGSADPGNAFALDRQRRVVNAAVGSGARHRRNICADPHLVPIAVLRFEHTVMIPKMAIYRLQSAYLPQGWIRDVLVTVS